MSIRLISYIFAFVVMAILGAFVYANNKNGRINKTFFLFTISADIWIFSLLIADNTTSLALIDLGARLAFVSSTATLCMLVIFTLALAYPKRKSTRTTLAFIVPATLLIATAPTSLAIQSVSVQDYGAGVSGGIAYDIFSLYAGVCLLAALITLAKGIKRGDARTKTQLTYLGLGLALTGVTAILTNLVFVSFAYLGPPSYLFLAGFTAFAVVKHRLFNVRAVVARSIAYVLLLLTLAGSYGATLFAVSNFLFPESKSSTAQSVVYVVLAVLLAFTFQPLKSFFEKLTDRIFFRDRYDSQVVLNEIGQILVAEFKLDRLLRKTLARISQDLKIGNSLFYVFEEDEIYKVEHYGAVAHKQITAKELQTLRHRTIVADELNEGHEKQLMEEYDFRVVMHLRTKEEFVGYLLLGDKLSGDIYTPQDIEVLEILSQELAVAISNAKAYEEIAEFNATLQGKVDDATKRLRSANIHLKELDQAKDEFISMASHQLRTPLTTIKGYLSMLQEGDAGKMKPEQLEFINYAYAGSQRMVNLISDLLNVSRMSAGKFLIEKAPIDLTQVTAEEVQQLQSHAVSKNLKLAYEPPKQKLDLVSLDENKTRQVIMNFIDNAVYYTKEGSVTVSLNKVGSNVELRVKDTGIGVPPDAQKKLFTKFYRAGNAQTVRPDGTGLGLYLAKRVVEDQGGTIIFETTEGKGSTFGFSLPMKAGKVDIDVESKQPPRQLTGSGSGSQ